MANHRYRLEIVTMTHKLDPDILTLFPELRCVCYSDFFTIYAFERSTSFVLSSELDRLNRWIEGNTIIFYEHRVVDHKVDYDYGE